MRIIAWIEDPVVIENMLTHFDEKGTAATVATGERAGAAGKSAPAHRMSGEVGRKNPGQRHFSGQINDRPLVWTNARRRFY